MAKIKKFKIILTQEQADSIYYILGLGIYSLQKSEDFDEYDKNSVSNCEAFKNILKRN